MLCKKVARGIECISLKQWSQDLFYGKSESRKSHDTVHLTGEGLIIRTRSTTLHVLKIQCTV
jgi:hypothetical protein